MSRRQPSNYDLVADLEANIAHAAWIETVIDDWTGPATSGGTGGGTAVSDSNPTEAAVLRHVVLDDPNNEDGSAHWRDTPTENLEHSARAQLDDLAELRRIASRMNARRHGTLNRMSLDQARTSVNERTTPSTIGFCEGCDRNCDASTDTLTLVGKLCGACRKAFQRWPRTADPGADRVAFLEHRKAETKQRRVHAS